MSAFSTMQKFFSLYCRKLFFHYRALFSGIKLLKNSVAYDNDCWIVFAAGVLVKDKKHVEQKNVSPYTIAEYREAGIVMMDVAVVFILMSCIIHLCRWSLGRFYIVKVNFSLLQSRSTYTADDSCCPVSCFNHSSSPSAVSLRGPICREKKTHSIQTCAS